MSKLFKKVKCRAYLRDAHDGVFITLYNSDGSVCHSRYLTGVGCTAVAYKCNIDTAFEEVEIKDLSEFDGGSVEKTYRKRIEEDFEGFVVGYTRINIKGFIGTTWETPPDQQEYGHCFKEVTETAKVAVVYYRNNAKRYVLPDDMEEIK